MDDIDIDLFVKALENVIENMDISVMTTYFSSDFVLESNRCLMSLERYRDHLTEAFKSLKSIELVRPLTDIFAKGDKLATRFSITITDTIGTSETADIIAIVQIKDNKIYRWWELSYPDWQTE